MKDIRIDILDEKAKGAISKLVDQDLIFIERAKSKSNKQGLVDIIDDISKNVTEPPMTMENSGRL